MQSTLVHTIINNPPVHVLIESFPADFHFHFRRWTRSVSGFWRDAAMPSPQCVTTQWKVLVSKPVNRLPAAPMDFYTVFFKYYFEFSSTVKRWFLSHQRRVPFVLLFPRPPFSFKQCHIKLFLRILLFFPPKKTTKHKKKTKQLCLDEAM